MFTIFSLLFILLGFISLAFVIFQIWARSWPAIAVSYSNMELHPMRVNGKQYWKLRIGYSYIFRGKVYSSTRETLFGGRLYRRESDAHSTMDSLRKEQRAHVCVKKPTLSYVREEKRFLYGAAVLGSFSILVGGFLYFAAVAG